ncbi:MAG: STAS-like domain-containing protein [Bacteroidetes bacterium]|nr:STAS-like domain-containing protein [Bacteroidota bacterium]
MKPLMLSIKDLSDSALSNHDGIQLQSAMDQKLSTDNSIIISFRGINTISSSFLNSSFGNIFDKYGINILSKIKIVDYTPSVANCIRKYVSDIKSMSSC